MGYADFTTANIGATESASYVRTANIPRIIAKRYFVTRHYGKIRAWVISSRARVSTAVFCERAPAVAFHLFDI